MAGKILKFEDLDVFKCARQLTNEIFAVSENTRVFKSFTLRDQMRRASISIMSNIAEGFEKRTTQEFIHFLYVSKGSAGELRAQLMIANDQSYLDNIKYNALVDKSRKVSAMLSNFIKYLVQSKKNVSNVKRDDVQTEILCQ